MQTAPPREPWLTRDQVLDACPELTARTLKTWADKGLIPYTKLTNGQTAPRLYRLRDIDALMAAIARPASNGPLAPAKPARARKPRKAATA